MATVQAGRHPAFVTTSLSRRPNTEPWVNCPALQPPKQACRFRTQQIFGNLRYFEAFGQVRRAISMLKKRTGSHENTIREFSISSAGLVVGPVLENFQGVLRGVPEYVGESVPLKAKDT
jgi:hypothetical protein